MRATQSSVGPTSAEARVQIVREVKEVSVEVKEVKGNDVLVVSQPMDVALEPCQGAQPSQCKPTAAVTKGRKKKAPKPSSCKLAAVTKGKKNKAPKDQQIEQALKIATHSSQGVPPPTDVAREPCQGAPLKKAPKAPKAPKEAQPTKQ
ncbi:hypothetical protein L7F22_045661, partial [Adiantum nelumboides]|nr:hypothetical protein [Adiantum nelumboides]